MSVKKIAVALAGISLASQKAVKLLNELSDNSFEGSVVEKEPIHAIGEVIRQLHLAKHEWELKEKYAGQSAEEIAVAQAAEREQEIADLQQVYADRLNALAAKATEPVAEAQPTPEPISDFMKETDRLSTSQDGNQEAPADDSEPIDEEPVDDEPVDDQEPADPAAINPAPAV